VRFLYSISETTYKCYQCEDDHALQNDLCVRRGVKNCIKFETNGLCKQCKPGYLKSFILENNIGVLCTMDPEDLEDRSNCSELVVKEKENLDYKLKICK